MTDPRHLAALCFVYTIAASNEYWLINWMNSWFSIRLAIFFALLQNLTWPLQILFYWYMRNQEVARREITTDMAKSYLILGSLSCFITLSRTVGLTTLPPTIYVICANTEIVFETIMTKIILHKDVNSLQVTAVLFVIVGVSISLYNPVSKRYGHNENIDQSYLFIGVILSLASRFASSLNTISAEKFLGKDAKSYFGVLEVSIANSVVPSIILPFALLFVPEIKDWGQLISFGPANTIYILALCIGISLSKYADRLCKFSIVHSASTLFFAVVDANMKVVAGLGSFLFFDEKIYWPQLLGFAFVVGSMVLSIFNKYTSNLRLLANKNLTFEFSPELQINREMSMQLSMLHHEQPQHENKQGYAMLKADSSRDEFRPLDAGSNEHDSCDDENLCLGLIGENETDEEFPF